MPIITVGSLFAGVGGICKAFEETEIEEYRYELEWANEIDKYACITYDLNFNHTLIAGNIKKVINPDLEITLKKDNITEQEKNYSYMENRDYIINNPVDILTAGFPCQAFSIAGNREGFQDDRGNLFYSILDLINLYDDEFKPRILLLENVKNLESHDNGNTFRTIQTLLENNGYMMQHAVINTKDITDIPQNRERIYMVCFRNENDFDNFNLFNNIEEYYTESNDIEESRINNIRNILDNNITIESNSEFFYYREKYPHYFLTEEEYNNIPEEDRRNNRINLAEEITEEFQFYQLRRGMYVRQNQSGVCPTLTANMGTGGHNVSMILSNGQIRKLTPKETFKLQGFDVDNTYRLPTNYTSPNFNFSNRSFAKSRLYKQAGNSVTIPVVKIIAEKILELFREN